MPSYNIVIPVHNGADHLARTLPALLSQVDSSQIIVVDDCSEDDSASVARKAGVRVLGLQRRSGPSAARNHGAEETDSDILVFADTDVLVAEHSVPTLVGRLLSTKASAVFGSYDDSPSEIGFISQYVNLRHHYVHQQAEGDANTFWAGFGAIRRKTFDEAGGFDSRFAGIEDIALGYQLKELGHSIILDPSIQVKHLKRWTFWSMIYTDVFMRAVPWSRLRSTTRVRDSLNLNRFEKVRALTAAGLVSGTALVLSGVSHWAVLPALFAATACINLPIFRFFARKRGPAFAAGAVMIHQLYYVSASITYGVVTLSQSARRPLKSVLRTRNA